MPTKKIKTYIIGISRGRIAYSKFFKSLCSLPPPPIIQKYPRTLMIYIILKIKNTDGIVFIPLLLLHYVYIGLVDNTVTFARSHNTDKPVLFLFTTSKMVSVNTIVSYVGNFVSKSVFADA